MKNFDWKKNGIKIGFGAIMAIGIIIMGFATFDNSFYGINVVRSLNILKWVTTGLLVIALAYSIYRIVTLKKTRKVLYSLVVVLLVALVAANFILPSYGIAANRFVGVGNYDKELAQQYKEEGRALTEKIQDEGIVMLENKNNTLPLQAEKINVFGYVSNSVIYGGTGSGGGKPDNNVTLRQGLENAGFQLNDELTTFYEDRFVPREKVDIHKLVGGDYNVHEPALSEYTDEMIANAKAHSNTAVVMFGRNAGEGADMAADMANYEGGTAGDHYLKLTANEKDLLGMLEKEFENVVVLLNAPNQLELGFLENEGVDAALWLGYPGSTGFNAVGNVLSGKVNPSGRLVDTYAYDLKTAPSFYNTGEFEYTNADLVFGKDTWHHKYINYAEGIYMGYMFYETRFVDNATGLVDEAAYNATVQYPFGYGLSYSQFEQKISNYAVADGKVSMEVTVTNTGTSAGKDVVQLYYTAPYTLGGIEKSHVVLGDFGKTAILEPGQSEKVNVTFDVEDMASYDYGKEKAYVLESGNYEIKLMKNAHEVIDARTYTVDAPIVYGEGNKRASDDVTAINQFDDIHGDDVVYLSRADWEGTFPKGMAQPKEASAALIEELNSENYVVDENAEPIVFAKNGLTLKDMKGLDYDDPQWEKLLEQLSIDEMRELITSGGFQTAAIHSIKKPATIDTDGPTGVNDIFAGLAGNQYTSEVTLASTWNRDLAYDMGVAVANEAISMHMTGLYMPGVNLHRSTLGGRNFEYYSEDPFISGIMGGSTAQGVADQGAYVYIKHYAMYDMETKRYEYPTGAVVWANEQTMREVYLKAFEVAIKNYDVTGVMSSYNRLGGTWVGSSQALMQTVLRDEWGFRGVVISDFYKPQYMDVDAGLAGGNDLILYPVVTPLSDDTLKTNWGHQNMRRASHNILYAIGNSGAYENAHRQLPQWMFLFAALDFVGIGLITFGLIKTTNSKKIKKETIK
ncbi:beta-glucosidase [Erysipelothrix sp. HDW6C]|uniref:glycoside hydrolase family 3 C-terminal domain-containing protein n=1 Tax=Erysipelothrix sp. HDW6C TaxID=2714930 RepID=UPI00140E37AB|nr:glycoside hydrolase family 3 C-terminal domain-containing protein [Erysipelothrix sp. HDW6C]QIK69458.1 beta-glucosidase [Erysipelothrix sp. HDW6C]